jgi:hypothetical protein
MNQPAPLAATSRGLDPFSKRNRRLGYVSDASVLLSCVYLGWRFGHSWSWPLFIWGVAAAVLVVMASLLMGWLSRRLWHLSAEQRATAVAQLKERAVPLYLPVLTMGLGVGVLAARWHSPWIDVLLTTMAVVLGILVPWLTILKVRRRDAQAGAASNGG